MSIRSRASFALQCRRGTFVAFVFAMTLALSAAPARASCIGDVNGDAQVNVTDILAVINGWGPCAPAPAACAADIAPPGGDGVVNVTDLLAVINTWGPCPCTPSSGCVQATLLWCEDFELGNYSRWTDGYYAPGPCSTSGFTSSRFISPGKSHRSQILCTSSTGSFRDYGGLRFQGDNLVSSFSIPSSGGTVAPHGVIVQFWVWLHVSYDFSPTRWLSLLTATHDCSNNWSGVVTLNLDDATRRLKPVHVSSVSYVPGAPAMPLQQWSRVTVYLDYNTGSMHVWQDGSKVVSATFSRPDARICQWHWGLYASGNNWDIIMYEDDIRIWKLQQPLTNFIAEPWVPGMAANGGCP